METRVIWDMSRNDFCYLKRMVIESPRTHAQQRVLKGVWKAQDEYFERVAREQRENLRARRETWTLHEAHVLIRNACKYILRHTKAYWYDKPAQESVKILAKLSKELRGEILAKSAFNQNEDTRDRDGIGEHLPCDRGTEAMDESPIR